ncbi:hypothetical protein EDF60_0037 [Leucobacter luti]|uniref:hypothetical protein n=1 Tax=Leucobacter luti TaxID=340320 RepID=UPI001043EE99|nr:hypothetical protein [Leucobacter luti]MCW2289026.1 hypothetical protein [Leucobacter luti]TCK44830.1 hypothetical protein EDF60_0037 [Leucobacter luti]
MRLFKGAAVVFSLTVVAFASACSAVHPQTELEPKKTSRFEGIYAEELQMVFDNAPNQEIKEIVSDGVITEAESQVIIEAFRSCLSANELTLETYDNSGATINLDNKGVSPDESQSRVEKCSRESGENSALALYKRMQQDPKNENSPETMVECYKRANLVPSDFTVEEFMQNQLDTYYPPEQLYEPSGAEALEKIRTCNDSPVDSYVG